MFTGYVETGLAAKKVYTREVTVARVGRCRLVKLRKTNYNATGHSLRVVWYRCVFCDRHKHYISQCYGDRQIWDRVNIKKTNRRTWKLIYRERGGGVPSWTGGDV